MICFSTLNLTINVPKNLPKISFCSKEKDGPRNATNVSTGLNINRQLGVSIMPLIPITALILFLQGGAL